MTDLTQLSALEQARMIGDREVSAEELLDAHLEPIEARNADLQAFVQLFEGWARRHARRIDRSYKRWPDELPTFWGVPFAIKDNDPMKWTFTRVGSRAYRFAWTPFDSLAVKRLRAAGFVMVGKTTTSEFALLPIVEPDIHPPTRNPWNEEHTAGGSSGGAAAAVAARMLPIAHGADGGGSIRIPASFCGLYGYKASRDVMPHFYGPLESVKLSVAGALARTVEDSAGVLDALCGRPVSGAGSWLDRSRGEPREHLRVRFVTTTQIGKVDPEIADAVRRVAAVLEAMGHDVSEGEAIEGNIDEFVPVYGRLAANIPILSERSVQTPTAWLRSIGRNYSNKDVRAINSRLADRMHGWFGDIDICITPTVGEPAPRVNAFSHLDGREQFRANAELGAFTAPFNITGQPAASLPVGTTADGLPIGVQIVGRKDEDELILRLSRALHEAGVWHSL